MDGELGERAKRILAEGVAASADNNTPFSLPAGDPTALLKSNCFPVDCPSEVYEFEVPDLQRKGAWGALRETIEGKAIAAGLLGRKVVALGLLDDIRTAFGSRIRGDIVMPTVFGQPERGAELPDFVEKELAKDI